MGGEGGQEALSRLKQTFSRVESSWRPASQEESYEIVRRRLFKEIPSEKRASAIVEEYYTACHSTTLGPLGHVTHEFLRLKLRNNQNK